MVAYDGSASKRIARKECRKNVAYIHDCPIGGDARISGNSDELEIVQHAYDGHGDICNQLRDSVRHGF